MNNGWVKIHRQLKDKGYYKDSEYVHLWLHLLLSVNREEKEFLWNKDIIRVKAGQIVTGRLSLQQETKINQHKIERILAVFENEGQIEQLKTSKYRLITLINWEKYQEVHNNVLQKSQEIDPLLQKKAKVEQQKSNKIPLISSIFQNNSFEFEQQVSNRRATSEQQVSTNKNHKNEENQEKGIDNPAMKAKSFFLKVEESGKSLIEFIGELSVRTGVPREVLSQEVRKFHSYWTEYDHTGKRQRWQKQETFEVDRRFRTWLQNAGKFNGARAPQGKQIL